MTALSNDWFFPPPGGWTLADVRSLPEDSRAEVLDGEVHLVVEVVSKGSRREDRGAKPLAYAEAGIRHFWRVESAASGAPGLTVHTFVLEGNAYVSTGEHTATLRTTLDRPIVIDVAKLTR